MYPLPYLPVGLSDCGGTEEVQEVMEGNSTKKFCLLLQRFNLDNHSNNSSDTKNDVSIEDVGMS